METRFYKENSDKYYCFSNFIDCEGKLQIMLSNQDGEAMQVNAGIIYNIIHSYFEAEF